MMTRKKITDLGTMVMWVLFLMLYFESTKFGNSSAKHCLVKDDDLTQKKPIGYETKEEMDTILKQDGVVDVTSNFDFIINWVILTTIIVTGLIFVMGCFCAVKSPKKGTDMTLNKCERIFLAVYGGGAVVAFIIGWAVRLALMIKFRGSHAGQVCSGDFLEEVFGQDYQEDADFKESKDLYQLNEGCLIWYSCLNLILIVTFWALNWIMMNKILPKVIDG